MQVGGAHQWGSCNNTLLRRVLRRFFKSKCFLEGFLEGTCRGFQLEGSVLEKALRRCLEGRNTSFRRVRPLRVHPSKGGGVSLR